MIAYTLKQDDDGQWNIRCNGQILASGLPLDSASQQARDMAHAERRDSGRPACVEVISADVNIHVATERQREPHRRRTTA